MRRADVIRVSSKGQIVLPKRYRDGLGIREGDYVTLYEVDEGILLLEKATQSPLEVIVADLRDDARRRKFTRQELAAVIKAKRAGRVADGD